MNKALLITLVAVGAVGLSVVTKGVFAQTPASNTNMSNHTGVQHETMQKAFDTGDYEAWKNALPAQAQSMMGQAITKENFAKFSEMHKLMQQGKYDEAGKIRSELGIGHGMGQGMGGSMMHPTESK